MDRIYKKEVLISALKGMDKEHAMIYDILKKIQYSYDNNLSAGIRKSLIRELYLFLDFHFTSEENILTMFGHPDSDIHKKEHDHLKHNLAETIGSFDIEQIDYEELERFVTDWLKSHTKHSDADLTEYLKAQYELK